MIIVIVIMTRRIKKTKDIATTNHFSQAEYRRLCPLAPSV